MGWFRRRRGKHANRVVFMTAGGLNAMPSGVPALPPVLPPLATLTPAPVVPSAAATPLPVPRVPDLAAALAEVEAAAAHLVGTSPAPSRPLVELVFTDGSSVTLAPDDPRTLAFRVAADTLASRMD